MLLVLIFLAAIPCAFFGQRFRKSYLTSQLTKLASTSDDVHTIADFRPFEPGCEINPQ